MISAHISSSLHVSHDVDTVGEVDCQCCWTAASHPHPARGSVSQQQQGSETLAACVLAADARPRTIGSWRAAAWAKHQVSLSFSFQHPEPSNLAPRPSTLLLQARRPTCCAY